MPWNCQFKWEHQQKEITNYVTFVDAIDRWRHENNEQAFFVTFIRTWTNQNHSRVPMGRKSLAVQKISIVR
jgi:hypothetical protein